MNKSFFLTTVVAFTCLLQACNSDSQEPLGGNNLNEPENYLNITYKGKTYKDVPTAYDSKGDFVFLDKDFAPIYNAELASDLDYSIDITGQRDLTFYPDLNTNLKSNGISQNPDNGQQNYAQTNSRAVYENFAVLTIYDDKNFLDRYHNFELNKDVKTYLCYNLKNSKWKFNDKCSSLKIANNLPNDPNQKIELGGYQHPCSNVDAVFIGYDDKNFSDRTITCIAHPAQLKEHPYLPGFNDKLSSFKFFFAQKGQYSDKF